jgi:aerobic-type carbon monoxide dehydrogenase small subunit (CoxS/CutS family)
VIVDGKPLMASTTLAVAVRGKKIETVESLGGNNPTRCRGRSSHMMPSSAVFARPDL